MDVLSSWMPGNSHDRNLRLFRAIAPEYPVGSRCTIFGIGLEHRLRRIEGILVAEIEMGVERWVARILLKITYRASNLLEFRSLQSIVLSFAACS